MVDKRRLLELDEQRRRAEADKMAAIRALEARLGTAYFICHFIIIFIIYYLPFNLSLFLKSIMVFIIMIIYEKVNGVYEGERREEEAGAANCHVDGTNDSR